MPSTQIDRLGFTPPVRVFTGPTAVCQIVIGDEIVEINAGSEAVTCVLPPYGGPYTIVDGSGAASAFPITILNALGATVGIIDTDGGSAEFAWDGTRMLQIDANLFGNPTSILDASTRLQIESALTGARPRALVSKVQEVVSLLDFAGVVGDAANDDTAGIQNAVNGRYSAVSIKGGVVEVPAGFTFKCGNITLPPGVSLRGPYPSGIGAPGNANLTPPWGTLSSLRLTAGSSITVSGGCSISGLFIAPSGMTFQQSVSTGWTGTAITMTSSDDIVVEKCMIMGFAMGISASLCSRLRLRHLNMDNISGISINGATDVCYLDFIHMWPWATIAGGGANPLVRSGTGIAMSNGNDDNKLTNCFTYGYAVGFSFSAMINLMIVGCNIDSTNVGVGIGFNLVGASYACSFIGCQASGVSIGFNITELTNSNIFNLMADCVAWSCTAHGVLVDTPALGDLKIHGGYIYACGHGITVASTTSRVDIDGVGFEANTIPIAIAAATTKVRVGPMCNFGSLAAGTVPVVGPLTVPGVATASNVLLPVSGDMFALTGTTGFGAISGGYFGRTVTLIFSGATTVTSAFTGATTDMRLSGGTSFVAATGSTLTLSHNGTQWFETGRAA